METGHQNSLPDWNEIIEGVEKKTDDTSKHVGKHRKGSRARHGGKPANTVSTGEHVLQCSIGIIFTIVIILIAQIGWMFFGHDLDSIHTQVANSKRVSLNQNIDLHTTRIAKPQSGEVPVESWDDSLWHKSTKGTFRKAEERFNDGASGDDR